ncbi:hypothetical protein AWC38_SpisGene13904 [Stylophora pistillata]|uniref:Uncharacterized protein n=1 Tax=Stylophora pistillata TaxID=50429 RepID=A0A2B4RXS6_STYPI|nr:hypothetical protein AWC38_SpisGene13904 [Stylophora pistillata]
MPADGENATLPSTSGTNTTTTFSCNVSLPPKLEVRCVNLSKEWKQWQQPHAYKIRHDNKSGNEVIGTLKRHFSTHGIPPDELTGATGEERSSEDDGSVDNSAKRQKLAGDVPVEVLTQIVTTISDPSAMPGPEKQHYKEDNTAYTTWRDLRPWQVIQQIGTMTAFSSEAVFDKRVK